MNVAGKGIDYSSEVHGAALNANDIESIKKFLVEYASKALLPYLEKLISQLSEVVSIFLICLCEQNLYYNPIQT